MHPSAAITLVLILGLARYADLTCVPNDSLFEWDAGLYPTLGAVTFTGGEPCFIGKMCSWFLLFSNLESSVDLEFSVTFTPPLNFYLSTNKFSMPGSEALLIDIPPTRESQAGQYTFKISVTAQNLTFRGCNDFEIRKPLTYNITKYTPTSNTTVLGYWDTYWSVVNGLNYPNLCNTPFNFTVNNDFSQYDPIKTFIANTQLNITTLDCLKGIANRFYDAVLYKEYQKESLSNQLDLFWTDGYQIYQKLYNASYNFVPLIDIWIQAVPNFLQGGVCSPGAIASHTRYVDALINRMARSGELDNRLPRAVNFLMNSMLPETFGVFTMTLIGYGNGAYELGYAMRTIATWGMLTGDSRVPYLLKSVSGFLATWIRDDFAIRDSLNITSYSPEASSALALGYAAYWRYNGDKANYDLALNLLNASLVLGATAAEYSGKHAGYFINRNYETFMWLLDPSIPLVSTKIPFVFPDIVTPNNNTVVLPNQTIVIETTTTILGNFQLSNSSTVSITYGNVLNITGCASLSGTLVVQVKDGQVILNDTVLLAYACRDGQFDQLVVEGDVDPCKEYQLSYTPTTLNIVIANSNLCVTTPSPKADKFPDWAIAVIVIGGLGICGAIIGIVLHFKKVEQKKENKRLDNKIEMVNKPDSA